MGIVVVLFYAIAICLLVPPIVTIVVAVVCLAVSAFDRLRR